MRRGDSVPGMFPTWSLLRSVGTPRRALLSVSCLVCYAPLDAAAAASVYFVQGSEVPAHKALLLHLPVFTPLGSGRALPPHTRVCVPGFRALHLRLHTSAPSGFPDTLWRILCPAKLLGGPRCGVPCTSFSFKLT